MSGQSRWAYPGTGTNDYVVNPQLKTGLYWESTYATIWGELNGPREVKETEIAYKGGTIVVDAGNDSPIWEKDFNSGVGELRFTMRKQMKGSATYGEADVAPGKFADYMHEVCYVIQHDSPIQPIPGTESEFNVNEVINDLIATEKDSLRLWMSQEIDIDGFRAALCGASRGMLDTTHGGRGITLAGAAAGQTRSCYNTVVEGQWALTTPSFTRATHEATLSTLLAAMTDTSTFAFDFDTHHFMSSQIDKISGAGGGFAPVSIGTGKNKRQFRAICLIDPRNVYRLQQDSYLAGATVINNPLPDLWAIAYERGEKNPALYNRQKLILDDILYVPCRQLELLRPTANGTTVVYGCDINTDPRDYVNTSNITMSIYMGAGALLRGRRTEVSFSVDDGKSRHGKGRSYGMHYHDGWKRREWTTRDGTSSISNDSMIVAFNFDPGEGRGYAA